MLAEKSAALTSNDDIGETAAKKPSLRVLINRIGQILFEIGRRMAILSRTVLVDNRYQDDCVFQVDLGFWIEVLLDV